MFIVAPFVIWFIIKQELKNLLYPFERDIILFSWLIITFISYIFFIFFVDKLTLYEHLAYNMVFWAAIIGALCGFFATLIAVFCFRKAIKKKVYYKKTIGSLVSFDKTINNNCAKKTSKL